MIFSYFVNLILLLLLKYHNFFEGHYELFFHGLDEWYRWYLEWFLKKVSENKLINQLLFNATFNSYMHFTVNFLSIKEKDT